MRPITTNLSFQAWLCITSESVKKLLTIWLRVKLQWTSKVLMLSLMVNSQWTSSSWLTNFKSLFVFLYSRRLMKTKRRRERDLRKTKKKLLSRGKSDILILNLTSNRAILLMSLSVTSKTNKEPNKKNKLRKKKSLSLRNVRKHLKSSLWQMIFSLNYTC